MLSTILIQVAIAICGILLYNLIAFRKHLKTDRINTQVFWRALWLESRFIWLWSLVVCALVSVAINLAPDIAESINTLTGWDVASNKASFLTLGFTTAGGTDSKK